MNDVSAVATGDFGGPDDHGVVDVVELQSGGCSRRHLAEVDDERFCLSAVSRSWRRRGSSDDDGLSCCCGCSGGDDGANIDP